MGSHISFIIGTLGGGVLLSSADLPGPGWEVVIGSEVHRPFGDRPVLYPLHPAQGSRTFIPLSWASVVCCQPVCCMASVSLPIAHGKPSNGASAQALPETGLCLPAGGAWERPCQWDKAWGRARDEGLAASSGAGRPAGPRRNLHRTDHWLPSSCHPRQGPRTSGAGCTPIPPTSALASPACGRLGPSLVTL